MTCWSWFLGKVSRRHWQSARKGSIDKSDSEDAEKTAECIDEKPTENTSGEGGVDAELEVTLKTEADLGVSLGKDQGILADEELTIGIPAETISFNETPVLILGTDEETAPEARIKPLFDTPEDEVIFHEAESRPSSQGDFLSCDDLDDTDIYDDDDINFSAHKSSLRGFDISALDIPAGDTSPGLSIEEFASCESLLAPPEFNGHTDSPSADKFEPAASKSLTESGNFASTWEEPDETVVSAASEALSSEATELEDADALELATTKPSPDSEPLPITDEPQDQTETLLSKSEGHTSEEPLHALTNDSHADITHEAFEDEKVDSFVEACDMLRMNAVTVDETQELTNCLTIRDIVILEAKIVKIGSDQQSTTDVETSFAEDCDETSHSEIHEKSLPICQSSKSSVAEQESNASTACSGSINQSFHEAEISEQNKILPSQDIIPCELPESQEASPSNDQDIIITEDHVSTHAVETESPPQTPKLHGTDVEAQESPLSSVKHDISDQSSNARPGSNAEVGAADDDNEDMLESTEISKEDEVDKSDEISSKFSPEIEHDTIYLANSSVEPVNPPSITALETVQDDMKTDFAPISKFSPETTEDAITLNDKIDAESPSRMSSKSVQDDAETSDKMVAEDSITKPVASPTDQPQVLDSRGNESPIAEAMEEDEQRETHFATVEDLSKDDASALSDIAEENSDTGEPDAAKRRISVDPHLFTISSDIESSGETIFETGSMFSESISGISSPIDADLASPRDENYFGSHVLYTSSLFVTLKDGAEEEDDHNRSLDDVGGGGGLMKRDWPDFDDDDDFRPEHVTSMPKAFLTQVFLDHEQEQEIQRKEYRDLKEETEVDMPTEAIGELPEDSAVSAEPPSEPPPPPPIEEEEE